MRTDVGTRGFRRGWALCVAAVLALAGCGQDDAPEASAPAESEAAGQAGTTAGGAEWRVDTGGDCPTLIFEKETGATGPPDCPSDEFAVLDEEVVGDERVALVRLPEQADLAVDGPISASLFRIGERAHVVLALPPNEACLLTAYRFADDDPYEKVPVGKTLVGSDGKTACHDVDPPP